MLSSHQTSFCNIQRPFKKTTPKLNIYLWRSDPVNNKSAKQSHIEIQGTLPKAGWEDHKLQIIRNFLWIVSPRNLVMSEATSINYCQNDHLNMSWTRMTAIKRHDKLDRGKFSWSLPKYPTQTMTDIWGMLESEKYHSQGESTPIGFSTPNWFP